MSEERPVNRRRFFREGLRELLRPLARAIDPLEAAARQLGELESAGSPGSTHSPPASRRYPLDVWLRPPGALEEQSFRDTCSKCGVCVTVCPAKCIKIDETGQQGAGVPYIDIDYMPCLLCDSLACMNQCPSGALLPTPISEIDMGTAIWQRHRCLRSRGEDCTICIDQCPVGQFAIELRNGQVRVIEDGCTGCGVCQYFCPTDPKAIVIEPKGARPQVATDPAT